MAGASAAGASGAAAAASDEPSSANDGLFNPCQSNDAAASC